MKENSTNPQPSANERVSCRSELPEDEAFLFAVYASTREDELALTNWDQQTRLAFLDMQFGAMRVGYASQFPNGEFSIIMLGDEPVGRMVVDRNAKAVHLVDIALLTKYRGRGIGTKLMKRLMAEAASANKPMDLYVFRGTPAMRLYTRLGFVKLYEEGPNDFMEWRSVG